MALRAGYVIGPESTEQLQLAEEIINALAQNPGLKVTARTSTFFFKDKDVKVAQIANEFARKEPRVLCLCKSNLPAPLPGRVQPWSWQRRYFHQRP
jgi:hypothetical protein